MDTYQGSYLFSSFCIVTLHHLKVNMQKITLNNCSFFTSLGKILEGVISDAEEFIGLIKQRWTLAREISFEGLEFGLMLWDRTSEVSYLF